jgi:hypothetical protein
VISACAQLITPKSHRLRRVSGAPSLLGVGAMNSPCYRPAGLLATWAVMLDGGGSADPGDALDACS